MMLLKYSDKKLSSTEHIATVHAGKNTGMR